MKTTCFVLIFAHSFFVAAALVAHPQNSASLQKLDKGVVKITSRSGNTGAGIVVGQDSDHMYILTAFHVIQESGSYQVKFYDRPSALPGQRFQYISRGLDVGVLIVALNARDALSRSFPKLLQGNPWTLKEGATVLSIGHLIQGDWQEAENERKNPLAEDDFQKLKIGNNGIEEGCSGGPLFDDRLQLIGMITEVSAAHAFAVKIDVILRLLKHWGIPINLIWVPAPPGILDKPHIPIPLVNRKATYLTTSFAVLTAGSVAWYFVKKNNADDELRKYNLAQSTEEAVLRRIQTEKAVSRRNIACYATIGAGSVFAALLVRDLIRGKPREFAEQSYPPKEATKKLGLRLDSNPHALSVNININF